MTTKVYQAINAVQAALAKEGIAKSRNNAQQGYKFRGIDDVFNALSPLLAEHKLCILPRVLSRECKERTNRSGNPLFYTVVDVEFDFVSAEDGTKHTIRTFGEAMDSADKSTNKAMSAAYKYAAMQAFAIPTEGDNDADATTHDVAPKADDAIAYMVEWQSYIDNENNEQTIRSAWVREKAHRTRAGLSQDQIDELLNATKVRFDEIRAASNPIMAG